MNAQKVLAWECHRQFYFIPFQWAPGHDGIIIRRIGGATSFQGSNLVPFCVFLLFLVSSWHNHEEKTRLRIDQNPVVYIYGRYFFQFIRLTSLWKRDPPGLILFVNEGVLKNHMHIEKITFKWFNDLNWMGQMAGRQLLVNREKKKHHECVNKVHTLLYMKNLIIY